MKDRVTITFQPTEQAMDLLDKAVKEESTPERPSRGLRTQIINRCIRYHLSNGKKSVKKAGQPS